jgi:hypothetical protein
VWGRKTGTETYQPVRDRIAEQSLHPKNFSFPYNIDKCGPVLVGRQDTMVNGSVISAGAQRAYDLILGIVMAVEGEWLDGWGSCRVSSV